MSLPLRHALAVTALAACALVLAADSAADDGGAAPVLSKDLIAKLGDANAVAGAAARAAAADELVRRGAAAVPDLVAALADTKMRESVAGVIERIGPAAKDAVPALAAISKGVGTPARIVVVRALGAIGADAAPALSALGAIVSFSRAKDRVEAATAIERILVDAAKKAPRTGGPSAVDKAVVAGCDWLVRHQAEDGGWDCDEFSKGCVQGSPCGDPGESVYDPGVTGLATLALLGAPGAADKRRAEAIDAALAYLLAAQAADGHFGPETSMHHAYNHACAALAVADAFGRTGRADLREPLERAVKWTLAAQNPYLAWRYIPHNGDNDTSVTCWMAKGLLRAEEAGVAVDRTWRLGALAWIEKMTEPEKGRSGYQQRGGPPARTSGMQNRFPSAESEALTACALVVRLGLDLTREDDEFIGKGLELLVRKLPVWDARGAVDLYYWMHGSEVMRLTGGREYDKWRSALVAALLPQQGAAGRGCWAGSWPGADPWSPEGGRIYTTSAAILSLEACSEDPATRPVLPGSAKVALDALTKTSDDDDTAVRAAVRRALGKVRSVYRP